ncbi:MAG TPA: class I SAM-dependent methyltransferase [Candidatus Elarobacter sp.]|jgi:SAM-dependent methyltransferase
MRLVVPESLQRNHPNVAERGYEETGEYLLRLFANRIGKQDLSGVDVLDVGCGVRFTQAIVNRGIPIRSYTGVEVSSAIVDFLTENVRDPRFRFAHWDVGNAMYHPSGPALSPAADIPVAGRYDLIVMYSVLTHTHARDAGALLQILRRHVRDGGRLIFTAFLDDALDGFEDRDPEHPLLLATYGTRFMRSLVAGAGWAVDALHRRDPENLVQAHFVCSPH